MRRFHALSHVRYRCGRALLVEARLRANLRRMTPARCLPILLALAAPTQAAELREPPRLSVLRQANDGCWRGPVLNLAVRQSLRRDVGPYAVRLHGYVGNPRRHSADSYAPPLIEAAPDTVLRLALANQAPAGAERRSNLHTHGLFTAPRPEGDCPPGDSSFFSVAPGTRQDYAIAIPATLPGAALGSAADRIPYPAGLSWFHAHVHELARDQVAQGMAGALSIGDARAALRGADARATRLLRGATDVRYVLFRDIQLTVPRCPDNGRAPDGRRCPAGQPMLPDRLQPDAAWPAGFGGGGAEDARWNPALCGEFRDPATPVNPAETALGAGYCAALRDDGGDAVWLFTVNGQHMPTATIGGGRNHLWRVANFSPSVTYVLELAEDGAAQPEAMRIVALDGGVQGADATSVGPQGLEMRRLLLMPGARAEIFVPNTATARRGRDLSLRTVGIVTGEGADTWPRMDLMRVRMLPQSAPPPAGGTPPTATPAPPIAAALHTPADVSVPEGCILLPVDTAERQWRRRVVLRQTREPESFLIGSEVVDQSGAPFTDATGARVTLIAPEVYPHSHGSDAFPERAQRLCPILGRTEVWEVVNESHELHNFHIHQGRFRLARTGDADAPADLTVAATLTDQAGQLTGLHEAASGAARIWMDSIPIPARRDDNSPGRAFIALPFVAPEQAGRFVFHCHILEHEDKGMMAPIEVLAPRTAASVPARSLWARLSARVDDDWRLPANCVVPR